MTKKTSRGDRDRARRISATMEAMPVALHYVRDISVNPQPLRPLNEEKVKRIAASMKQIGLMNPITIRHHEDRPCIMDGEEVSDTLELIAGRHRLAAAKLLGWEKIDTLTVYCSDVDARLWEISENLDRAELTPLERDEHIAEWIKLTEVSTQAVAKPQGGRPEGGVNAAARELGINREDARRAVKVASLSDEAKAAAVEHGVDNNRSVLLQAAKQKTPEGQVYVIKERAARPAPERKKISDEERRRKIDRDLEKLASELNTAERDRDPNGPIGEGIFDRDGNRVVGSANNPRAIFLLNCQASIEAAESYAGPVDDEIIAACRDAADAWNELADDLESRSSPSDTARDICGDDEDADHEEGLRVIAKRGFVWRANEAASLAHYPIKNLVVTEKIVRLADDVAESWQKLADELKEEFARLRPER